MPVFAAVDIGASGGRVMAGVVDGETISLHPVHRFPNGVVVSAGHLRWDFEALFEATVTGLARVTEPLSIGIDTWAVDYGLLDEAGRLLAPPVAYRDDRTTRPLREGSPATPVDAVHDVVPPAELYAINGLQYLPFNTLYQLAAEREGPLWQRAAHAVLIPDLLAYRLTGALGTELTNASTTGLVDARRRQWAEPLLDRLGLPAGLLPPLGSPGERRGATASGVPVVDVGSHDTASAVVGVPTVTDRFAYVSCGTWSLVGLELPTPVLTEQARTANFTNEIGVDGTTRFLRNVGGLWLLQECLRAWGRQDLDALLAAAAALRPGGPQIDVDDPTFIAPGAMPARIAAAAGRALDLPETVRCILDSLAAAFASTIERAQALAGRAVDVVHLVGGGSQNEVLCRLTAEATGRPVLAGPVEATALGNVAIQARAAGVAPASLEGLRAMIGASVTMRRYEPA